MNVFFPAIQKFCHEIKSAAEVSEKNVLDLTFQLNKRDEVIRKLKEELQESSEGDIIILTIVLYTPATHAPKTSKKASGTIRQLSLALGTDFSPSNHGLITIIREVANPSHRCCMVLVVSPLSLAYIISKLPTCQVYITRIDQSALIIT